MVLKSLPSSQTSKNRKSFLVQNPFKRLWKKNEKKVLLKDEDDDFSLMVDAKSPFPLAECDVTNYTVGVSTQEDWGSLQSESLEEIPLSFRKSTGYESAMSSTRIAASQPIMRSSGSGSASPSGMSRDASRGRTGRSLNEIFRISVSSSLQESAHAVPSLSTTIGGNNTTLTTTISSKNISGMASQQEDALKEHDADDDVSISFELESRKDEEISAKVVSIFDSPFTAAFSKASVDRADESRRNNNDSVCSFNPQRSRKSQSVETVSFISYEAAKSVDTRPVSEIRIPKDAHDAQARIYAPLSGSASRATHVEYDGQEEIRKKIFQSIPIPKTTVKHTTDSFMDTPFADDMMWNLSSPRNRSEPVVIKSLLDSEDLDESFMDDNVILNADESNQPKLKAFAETHLSATSWRAFRKMRRDNEGTPSGSKGGQDVIRAVLPSQDNMPVTDVSSDKPVGNKKDLMGKSVPWELRQDMDVFETTMQTPENEILKIDIPGTNCTENVAGKDNKIIAKEVTDSRQLDTTIVQRQENKQSNQFATARVVIETVKIVSQDEGHNIFGGQGLSEIENIPRDRCSTMDSDKDSLLEYLEKSNSHPSSEDETMFEAKNSSPESTRRGTVLTEYTTGEKHYLLEENPDDILTLEQRSSKLTLTLRSTKNPRPTRVEYSDASTDWHSAITFEELSPEPEVPDTGIACGTFFAGKTNQDYLFQMRKEITNGLAGMQTLTRQGSDALMKLLPKRS